LPRICRSEWITRYAEVIMGVKRQPSAGAVHVSPKSASVRFDADPIVTSYDLRDRRIYNSA